MKIVESFSMCCAHATSKGRDERSRQQEGYPDDEMCIAADLRTCGASHNDR